MSQTSPINLFRNTSDFKSFSAGTVIFNQGDPGDYMYVVKEGTVNITVGDRLVETVEAGGVFGEMALIDNEARSASASAKTDCQLVPIDGKKFRFLIQQTPFFAQHVIRVLAQRLRNMNKQLARS
jgi:CRP/FNR family transcriptional regulator, cyclic AMP receptor protein